MNRELLEKPFDLSQIKQREGNFGKMLDYIEGHAVIERLNMAFEAEWSFSILKHEVLEQTDEVIVLGQLRAGDVVKTQFGSSKITRAGNQVSLSAWPMTLKPVQRIALKNVPLCLVWGCTSTTAIPPALDRKMRNPTIEVMVAGILKTQTVDRLATETVVAG